VGDTVGQPTCTSCAAGSAKAAASTSTTVVDTCPTCAAGSYTGTTGASTCATCAAGTVSTAGSSTCSSCDAGSYSSTGDASCTTCPAGKTAATSGTANCATCPTGKYTANSGTFSCQTCASCNAGYATTTTCTAATDRTCEAYAGTCSGGSLAAQALRTQKDHCGKCDPGYALTSKACTKCAAGTSSAGDTGACTACGTGYNSVAGAASCFNIDDCANMKCKTNDSGATCADGVASFVCSCSTGFVGTECKTQPACPANSARNGNACACVVSSDMTKSYKGTLSWSSANGAWGGNCVLNNPCLLGEDDCDSNALCTHSGVGTHTCACKISAGYSGNGKSCGALTGCAAGTYRRGYSATSSGTCVNCEAGKFKASVGNYASQCAAVSECPAGQTRAGVSTTSAGTCAACASGTFKASAGTWASKCTAVQACARGTYRAGQSASSGGVCSTCAAGTFKATTGVYTSACAAHKMCSAGQQASLAGTASSDGFCETCPQGKFSTTAKSSSSKATSACAVFSICAAGTYTRVGGAATTDNACTACVQGKRTTNAGQTACTVVSCPALGLKTTAGACAGDCMAGYSGYVSWSTGAQGYSSTCADINGCNNGPCTTKDSSATCTNQVGKVGAADYVCKCSSGWKGSTCATDVVDCVTGKCKNSGVCTEGAAGTGRFSCKCANAVGLSVSGWTGAICDNDINECAAGPCSNKDSGATCTQGAQGSGKFSCVCTDKMWSGTTCTTDFDNCAAGPCQNGAACTEGTAGTGGITCACVDGTHGATCATRASCPANSEGSTCSCKDGYNGVTKWDAGINAWTGTCSLVDCGDPGSIGDATASGTSFKWNQQVTYVCKAPFVGGGSIKCLNTGSWSTKPACQRKACPANAAPNGSGCKCVTGYVGSISWSTAAKDWTFASGSACALDSCYSPGAVANAAITTTLDATTSYLFNKAITYKCGAGYSAGATVMTIKCKADCISAGSCSGVKWEAKPVCADIDECAASNGGCDQICTNVVGNVQAKCSCRSGFKFAADGNKCVDVNDCVAGGIDGNAPCSLLDKYATCADSGSNKYKCSCSGGFSGNQCKGSVACPAKSAFAAGSGTAKACGCISGYTGTITWDSSSNVWLGSCGNQNKDPCCEFLK